MGKKTLESNGVFCHFFYFFILNPILACFGPNQPTLAAPCETLFCLMIMQVYIVYMGSLPTEQYSPLSNHFSLLQEVVEGR